MSVAPDLALQFTAPDEQPAGHARRSWRGCSAEHVEIAGTEGFSYERTGSSHYIALHDLQLADGEIRVADGTRNDARDLRGTVSFFPTGCAVSGWSVPAKRNNSFTALYFEPAMISEELGARYEKAGRRPLLYAHDPRAGATLEKIRRMLVQPDDDPLYAETLCLTAALEVLSEPGSGTTGGLSHRQLERVIECIHQGQGRELTLSELAAVAGLSRFHFARAFKKSTGKAPHQFVTEFRLERARDLLETTARPINDISLAVGFGEGARLRRVFIARYGVSPQFYRRSRK